MGDYISRKALLEELDGLSLRIGGSANAMALTIMDETKKAIREIIKDRPAASPLEGVIGKLRELKTYKLNLADAMSELIEKDKLGNYVCLEDVIEILEAAVNDTDKENGKLLSCKVGDTVWELCKRNDDTYRIFPMKVAKVVPYGAVRWIKGKEPVIWNIYAVSDCTDMYKSFYDLGQTVFLTEPEAEAALKEMEAVR